MFRDSLRTSTWGAATCPWGGAGPTAGSTFLGTNSNFAGGAAGGWVRVAEGAGARGAWVRVAVLGAGALSITGSDRNGHRLDTIHHTTWAGRYLCMQCPPCCRAGLSSGEGRSSSSTVYSRSGQVRSSQVEVKYEKTCHGWHRSDSSTPSPCPSSRESVEADLRRPLRRQLGGPRRVRVEAADHPRRSRESLQAMGLADRVGRSQGACMDVGMI